MPSFGTSKSLAQQQKAKMDLNDKYYIKSIVLGRKLDSLIISYGP